MGKHALTEQYRAHLKQQGYAYAPTRHTEPNRRRGQGSAPQPFYTVTLTAPDGRVSRHHGDTLVLAYRAACAATPKGVPEPPTDLFGVRTP